MKGWRLRMKEWQLRIKEWPIVIKGKSTVLKKPARCVEVWMLGTKKHFEQGEKLILEKMVFSVVPLLLAPTGQHLRFCAKKLPRIPPSVKEKKLHQTIKDHLRWSFIHIFKNLFVL